MKIGVISDTHLKDVDPRLTTIYQKYFFDVDMIIHAGDLVSPAIVDFFSKKPLHVVQGNMYNSSIQARFPKKALLDAQGFRLGLIHGWGSPFGIERRIRSEFKDVHVIVYGHSHRPANHMDKGILFFNPGTATGQCISGSNSIGILDIGEEVEGTIIKL